MNKLLLPTYFILFLSFWGCGSDDESVPIAASFSSETIGLSSDISTVDIAVVFSRPAEQAGTVILELSSANLVYGVGADYYTNPVSTNGQISIPFIQGAESVSVIVSAGETLNIDQEETVEIVLANSVEEDYTIGQNGGITVLFSENYVAKSGIIQLDAGGATFELSSFTDLSKRFNSTVDKYSWDLGFSTTVTAVVLNSTSGVMARSLDKFDLSSVTVDDTLGFGAVMSIPPPNYDPSIGAMSWVDAPNGDLTKTAFGEIATSTDESPVFIIKRDNGQSWKKVKVIRNGRGYTVEHADISATTVTTLDIVPNEEFNFMHLDLDNALTSVEPKKSAWDLMYGTYTEALNLGGPELNIPYAYKDFLILNRHNTRAAIVMLSVVSYENFAIADVSSIVFDSAINTIGAKWRAGGGPNSTPSLYDDRFFVLEDSDDNIYKVQFTRLTSTSGERGYPEFRFELVK